MQQITTPSNAPRIGKYVPITTTGDIAMALVPRALPPNPPIDMARLRPSLDAALLAIGRLDGISDFLPDRSLFLYMYIRKEALLSSQIEGTQSSLSDLFLFENEALIAGDIDDIRDVSNYINAMTIGLERLRKELPLSLRLIRDIHSLLLADGRGSNKQPGTFRQSQNWIGGNKPSAALYVPPPPQDALRCMNDLEIFIHADTPDIPVLIKAGLIHHQFETIHPFLDGNGRLGRLLITFFLCAENVLKDPTLYLSLYFKTHRATYYELLQRVRDNGDWEAWLEFFLTGVKETSDQAAETARRILEIFERDRRRIEQLGRPAASALRVHQYLQSKPILSVPVATKELSLSAPTVRKSVEHLTELDIVREATGKKRDKLFVYDDYLALLNEGTEAL